MDSRHRIYRFSGIIRLSLWIAIPCIACLHSSRIEAADATKTPIQLCQTSKATAKEYLSSKGMQIDDANSNDDVADSYNPPDCSPPSWRANFPYANDYDGVKGQLTALCAEADGTLSEIRDPSHPLAAVSATCKLKGAANPTRTSVQACKDTADRAERALERLRDSRIGLPDSSQCLPLNWQLIPGYNYDEIGYTDADRKRIEDACTKAGGVSIHPAGKNEPDDQDEPDIACTFDAYGK